MVSMDITCHRLTWSRVASLLSRIHSSIVVTGHIVGTWLLSRHIPVGSSSVDAGVGCGAHCRHWTEVVIASCCSVARSLGELLAWRSRISFEHFTLLISRHRGHGVGSCSPVDNVARGSEGLEGAEVLLVTSTWLTSLLLLALASVLARPSHVGLGWRRTSRDDAKVVVIAGSNGSKAGAGHRLGLGGHHGTGEGQGCLGVACHCSCHSLSSCYHLGLAIPSCCSCCCLDLGGCCCCCCLSCCSCLDSSLAHSCCCCLVQCCHAELLVLLPTHNVRQILVWAGNDGGYPLVGQPCGISRPLDQDSPVSLSLALFLHLNMGPTQLSDGVDVGAASANDSADGVGRHTHFLALPHHFLPASISGRRLGSSPGSSLLVVLGGCLVSSLGQNLSLFSSAGASLARLFYETSFCSCLIILVFVSVTVSRVDERMTLNSAGNSWLAVSVTS